MVLTLPSSISFINLQHTKTPNTYNEFFSSTVSFAQMKPTCRLQAKNSTHDENYNLSHDRIISESSHADNENELRVPVLVMLPLDTITNGGKLNRPRSMNASLRALKNAGVQGVMVDVWWGLVEKEGPMMYNWEGYSQLVKMVQDNGLKLQVVMSFHQCGDNVGDSCSISLPPWVLEEISKNPDLLYTDMSGRRNPEYISLGCDSLHVLKGRTPIQVYSDFMRSFKENIQDYFGDVIVEIQVGMGPCGELRYPSYPESNATWNFPGIGELQCYDKYMKSSLKATEDAAGKKDGRQSKPCDTVQYNQFPEETKIIQREGRWNTEYGRFFLEWYSSKLIEHGDKILTSAEGIFRGTKAKLSVKVSGIHWHYGTRSHADELTTGYYNPRQMDGYLPLAQMLGKNGVVLNFTYKEMGDLEWPENVKLPPEGIIWQVKMAKKTPDYGNGFNAFTYLRMNKRLFEEENWRNFVELLRSMVEGGRETGLPDIDTTGTDIYVRFIK